MLIYVIVWLLSTNLASIALFQIDKVAARHKQWRVADKYFLTLAMIGGSLGALLGMQIIRNKNRRREFKTRVQIIFILQIAVTFILIQPEMRYKIIELYHVSPIAQLLKK